MNTYDFTRSRIFQWLGILLALGLIAVSYWYYRSQASTLNSPSTDPISTGLAGYWALDEGTGTSATDSSTNGSTGTLTNSPTWTTGQIGSAVDFDGVDDYIDVGTAGLTLPTRLTGALWVKVDDIAFGKNHAFLSNRTSGNTGWSFGINSGGTCSPNPDCRPIQFTIQGVATYFSSAVVYEGQWTHVVFSWDGSTVNFFINGSPGGSASTGSMTTGTNLLLGTGGPSPGTAFLDGSLDEVRIYNRALSADEVSELYHLTSPTGVDTSLKGYWSFNGKDVSGTTAYDRSGAGNTGTLTNGPTITEGRVGQALNFFPNGSDNNSRMLITDPANGSLDFGSGDFSVGFWMKGRGYSDQTSSLNVPLAKKNNDSAGTAGYAFYYTSSNLMTFRMGNGTTDYNIAALTNTVSDNGWHFYIGTRSGTTLTLFIDSIVAGSTTVSGSTSNSENLAIGADDNGGNGNSRNVNAIIDEVRIYGTALTATQIQSLYALGQSDKVNTSMSQSVGTGRLDSGLALYWPLDDGTSGATPTTAADSSTNANTGTLTGGPTWTTGQIGSAVDFDGTDDYVTVADTDALDVTDGTHFTLTGWFNRDTYTADHTIIAKRNGQAAGDTGYVLYVDDTNDDVVFEVSDGTDEYSRTSTSSFTATGWQHVAAVFDDTLGMTIYINGTVNQDAASGTIGNIGSLANTVAFRSGAESDAGSPFDGKLDEIRLYNRVLSPDEVNQLYRLTAPTSVDATLDAYWSFDGHTISGTTLYDQSGRSKNGTLMNGVQITEGKIGQALLFDGVDDRVNVTSVTTGTTFTITAWVMPRPGGPSYGHIFGVNQNTCFEYHNANNKLTYNHSGGYNDSNTALVDNEWNFVGMVVTAGNGVFYLDGNPDGTKTGIGTANFAEIGWNTGGEYFNGKIDELRFYGRALSAAEMKALYTQGVSSSINSGNSQPEGGNSPDGGLAGYWALDDGSGTTATDSSTNGNTGTLTNGPTWTTGQMNGAVDFDGTDDYITIADADSLDIPDSRSFTLSGWFNRDTYAADHTILAKANGQTATDTGYIVYIDDATDQLIFNASDGTDRYQLASTSTFASSSWRHFAVVWTEGSTSLTELYVDGFRQAATATGTQANVNSLANSNALRIGAESDNGNPFDGKLDEIRIYGRAFTRAGVLDLFRTTSPTGTDTSLKGYWSFNGPDIASTTAYDRSGAGNIGTLTNGPSITEGKMGQALSFDGSNDYVSVATAPVTASPLTLTAWIKTTASGVPLSMLNSSASPWYGFYIGVTSGTSVSCSSVNNNVFTSSTSSMTAGQWQFVACVMSSTTSRTVYVNGSAGTTDTTSSTVTTLPNTVTVGATNHTSAFDNFFTGSIDEVRVYNRALSASEIQSLYNMGR